MTKKKDSKPVFFGSSSIGLQISTNWFLNQSKSTNGENIDYKGINQIIVDLMGNHINYSICFYSSVKQQVEQGNLRIVAVVGDTFNNPELKKLPKIQRWVPTMDANTQRFGFVVGPDADPETVKYYSNMLTQVMRDPKFVEEIERDGNFLYDPSLTSKDFADIAQQERKALANQIKLLPVKADTTK